MSRGFVKRAYNTKKIKIGLGYRVWLMISIIFIGASFTGYITVNQDTLFYSDLISPTKKVVLHDISKVDFIGRIQMITISSRRSAPRQYCELSFTIDIHKNNSVEMYSAQPGPAKRYTVYRLFNILKNKNVPVEAFVDTDGGGCNQDDISKFTQEMKSQMGL